MTPSGGLSVVSGFADSIEALFSPTHNYLNVLINWELGLPMPWLLIVPVPIPTSECNK